MFSKYIYPVLNYNSISIERYYNLQVSSYNNKMYLRILLLLVIVSLVVSQKQSNDVTSTETQAQVGFWNTFGELVLSEDSFKSWFLNMLEWIVFVLAETAFKMYF